MYPVGSFVTYRYRFASPDAKPSGSSLVHFPVLGLSTRFTAKFRPVTVSRSIPAKPINRSPFDGLDSSSCVPKGAVIYVIDDRSRVVHQVAGSEKGDGDNCF